MVFLYFPIKGKYLMLILWNKMFVWGKLCQYSYFCTAMPGIIVPGVGQAVCTCRNYTFHLEQKSIKTIGEGAGDLGGGGGWGDLRSEGGRRSHGRRKVIWNGHGYRQSHWVRLTVTVCILFCSWWECARVHYRGYSLRGDSMTDGWLKLFFVKEILVRPMSCSAT